MRYSKINLKTAVLVICTLLLLCPQFIAQVPMLVNYQGRLTDLSGSPRNGTFTMTFAFFDAATAGNKLPTGSPWEETQSVQVANGAFNVLLGSVTALPSSLFSGGPSDTFGPLRFLEVKVNGEALLPRPRIVSAPYAVRTEIARFADTPTVQGPPGTQGPSGPPGPQGPPGPTVGTVAACGIVDNPAAICECPFGTVANIKGPCTATSTTGSCFTSDPSHRCCVCRASNTSGLQSPPQKAKRKKK
jgi:hypothetical protein